MSLLFRALGLALAGVAVLVAAMPVLDWIPFVRGSLPANHALAAYGIDRARVPRVPGKRFVVTGASSGVGLGTAKLLAEAGGVVHMACRAASKCARARDAMAALARRLEHGTRRRVVFVTNTYHWTEDERTRRLGELRSRQDQGDELDLVAWELRDPAPAEASARASVQAAP